MDAIQEDIHWLGFDWDDRFYYASDYFEQMYRVCGGAHQKGPRLRLRAQRRRRSSANRGDVNTPASQPLPGPPH